MWNPREGTHLGGPGKVRKDGTRSRTERTRRSVSQGAGGSYLGFTSEIDEVFRVRARP